MKKLKRSIIGRIIRFVARAGRIVSDRSVRLICYARIRNVPCDVSLSQYGQDVFVKNYFAARARKERYVFVDIGANDGLSISNTYALEYASKYPGVSSTQNWGGGCL